jgi:integrase
MEDVSDSYHLICRNGVWYYRRRVPEHLAATIGKKVIQFSLQTNNKKEAKKHRDVWDARWSLEFEKAEHCAGEATQPSAPDSPPRSRPVLFESSAIRLLRDQLEQLDRRAQREHVVDGPASEEERREMISEIGEELQILRNVDDPRGGEWTFFATQGLLKRTSMELDEQSLPEAVFDELVRRMLMELKQRKLARLTDNHRHAFFDSLFDPARPPEVTFGELAEQYLQLKEEDAAVNRTSRKTLDKQQANVALIRHIVGDETPVAAVDYDSCLRVVRTLSRVPTNWTKLYKGTSLEEAIERAAAEGKPTLSAITQQQYLAAFRELLDLAAKKRLIPINPADGLRPLKRDDVALAEKRAPFTLDQIAAFFRSKFYADCAASGPAPYRFDTKGGWRFWLPLLCLFTGMRPKEVCQAHSADVRCTEKGIWYFDVTPSDEDENEAQAPKTVKTLSSKRRIPIHPELVKVGFIRFVEERQKITYDPRLFPIKPNKYGDQAHYPLKRFRDHFLPQAIAMQERQTFYSFRHSFRDALRRIEAGPEILLALGWTQSGRIPSDNYGSQMGPDQLFKHVQLIAFPGLNLSHLYLKQK